MHSVNTYCRIARTLPFPFLPKFGPARLFGIGSRMLVMAMVLVSALVATCPAVAQEAVLHIFGLSSTDGIDPISGLVFDSAGNLYGTTPQGGDYGYGTVFELVAPNWDERIIYNFTGGSDGNCSLALGLPVCSGLVFDGQGNLYGTAPGGGAYGYGVVFELSPTGTGWTQQVLYSFGFPGNPLGGVIIDPSGNLYGTTSSDYYEAQQAGTVYKLSQSGGIWTEAPIYYLPFGVFPGGGLAMDTSGNIYGGYSEPSTVYKLSPNGLGSWGSSVVYVLGDRAEPTRPVLDGTGNIYGVTPAGGPDNDGTVYKLTLGKKGKWTGKTLYNFTASPGYYAASVVLDSAGNLYGTSGGGIFGYGMVYELVAPGYKEKTLFSFHGIDGGYPSSNLIFDNAGNLYGTTQYILVPHYPDANGTVFEVNPSAAATTTGLSSSPNPSTSGEAVLFNAVVIPSPPDGETVNFYEGTTVLGTGTLSDGAATLSYSALPVGTTKVTAVYVGDLNLYSSTSSAVKQVVKK